MISIDELRHGHVLSQQLEQIGVPILPYTATTNVLQMSETDRVDRYNDLKAL